MNNLEEMDKFLETQNLPRLHHKQVKNVNRHISNKESESIIKSLPTKKTPGPDSFTGKFY